MKALIHNSMVLVYEQREGYFGLAGLYPLPEKYRGTGDSICIDPADLGIAPKTGSRPPFHLTSAGQNSDPYSGHAAGGSILSGVMKCTKVVTSSTALLGTWLHEDLALEVRAELRCIAGSNCISQHTVLRNLGTEPRIITKMTSADVMDPSYGGVLNWHDPKKIRVHYCVSRWQGEGQWRSASLEQLGLYPCSIHANLSAVKFQSMSSWSTSEYYPMVMVENLETRSTWFGEIEALGRWQVEIGHRKSDDSFDSGGLYISMDCADEMSSGWFLELHPGQEHQCAPAVYGCTAGGFEQGVHHLYRYRRLHVPVPPSRPVVFNDYMNCLWAQPSSERLLPLIDAASAAGAEAFCIDAGWYQSDPPVLSVGDWEPDDLRFGPGGLGAILSEIRRKGMIPGLWLEMETVHSNSRTYQQDDSWFAQIHGCRVHGDRALLDFRNSQVRQWMMEKISFLVEILGVGYIKNDYNQSLGYGDTKYCASPADGIRQHMEAFYRFIDQLRKRFPQVIFENCASGAMRSDFGAVRHFHLQSTSDQEHFQRYPSIVVGSTAFLLPEQAGIWAYPFPVLFEHKDATEEEKRRNIRNHDNPEETVFTMITGMCGRLYLSGRIDAASPGGFDLVSQAVKIYKGIRDWLYEAFPVYPLGRISMGSDETAAALGFIDETSSRMILAVWKLQPGEDAVEVDLGRWCGEARSQGWDAQLIYPGNQVSTSFTWNTKTGVLKAFLPVCRCARLFQLKLRSKP